jgi:hypothetical protein
LESINGSRLIRSFAVLLSSSILQSVHKEAEIIFSTHAFRFDGGKAGSTHSTKQTAKDFDAIWRENGLDSLIFCLPGSLNPGDGQA